MKLRNILMVVATMGIMFSSADRVGVVGYTEGDYSDMGTFAHKVAGQNVAWTAGNDFTAVWSDGGTTWGFSSGDAQDLVDMWWSNGTYGLNVGLNMTPDSGTPVVAGETTFDLAFGTAFMGWDVGFKMNTAEDSDMALNARGKMNCWIFDTMTFGYGANGADGIMAEYTTIDVGLYSVNEWGPATGMFGLGFTSSSQEEEWTDADMTATTAINADGYTAINTNFSVESTLTDWCDLRMGYSKSFNVADNSSSDAFLAGVGFNYGSVGLDMTLGTDVLGDMMSNPLYYVNGRNDDNSALAAHWTLSYSW
jgi:hypothetical protein